MRRVHKHYKPILFAALILGSALLVESAAAAPADSVRVEVSVAPAETPERVKEAFARLVRREVARRSAGTAPRGAGYVLAATLVKLETQAQAGSVTASCQVTAALRERNSGTLRAVLRGGARASDAESRAEQTRTAAMEAAVHSALSKLETALPDRR